jgi:hypothetical protein
MAPSKLRPALISAAAAAVLGGTGVPAQAGNYMGAFDPVDFSGTYTIFIPDSCITSGTYWLPNNSPCGSMSFGSATVNVVSDGTGGDPLYSGLLTFTPVDAIGQLLGIFVENGVFAAPDTTLIQNTGSSPTSPDQWFIQFTSGQCGEGSNLFMPSCESSPGTPSGSAVYTQFPFCTDCDGIGIAAEPQQVLPPGNVFIYVTAVPEPGTLALLLGALGGGWLARRRRQSAA